MNKRGNIALIIGIIVVVLIVIGVIVGSANDKVVLTIGKTNYETSDFDLYCKTMIYDGSMNATDDVETMFEQYVSYKVFYNWAEEAGITASGDEIGVTFESGDEEKLVNGYEISVDDYTRVKTEMAIANKLASDAYNLGKVPKDVQDYYKSYLNSTPSQLSSSFGITLKGSETIEDYMKMVDYRVFEVPLPTRESGEEVDGLSGDALASNDILNAKLKAQDALASIKASIEAGTDANAALEALSGDFEETSRYTATPDNLYSFATVSNWDLSTISRLYAYRTIKGSLAYLYGLESSQLMDQIVDVITNKNAGEFTDVFTTDDSVGFVYIEAIRDGLEDPDLSEFKSTSSTYYIYTNTDYVTNKLAVKVVDYTKLPAEVEKAKAAEAADDTANEEISGEASGESPVYTIDLSGDLSGNE